MTKLLRRESLPVPFAILGAISLLASAPSHAADVAVRPPIATCASLTGFLAPSVEITGTEDVPAGPLQAASPGAGPIELPAHCRVTGVIEKRTGVGGKPYGIQFEMRLPQDWNGRFLFQGGGGTNGFVAPAIGSVKGPAALTRGYAVVTQDGGHEGRDSSFGEDQQARLDMEYRSYFRITTIGKQLVAAYYGKPAERSYFMGCSEGGREALLVSQRLPLEYDGVVAGDPGFTLGVTFHANSERMIIAGISPKGADGKPDYSKAFSDTDLKLIETKIESDCDGLDGLKDGMIDNPTACRPKLESLICKGSKKTDQCLTKPQVHALRSIFEGGSPTGFGGVKTEGYFYNTGVDLPAWRGKLAGPGGLQVKGVGSFQGLFLTPYEPDFDDSVVDFAKLGPRFVEVGALNRADGVMYSSYKQHGGKVLMYTGTADQAFSAKELVAYYQYLSAANGGAIATADFARLFLVPGMTHCRGGKALDEFDPLQALVDWVEQDKAPEQMVATGKTYPGRSRPVCAYPTQSRYKGTGSIEDAANFECRMPE
jgi:feruloyl esterase